MSAEGSGLVPRDHPDRIRWNAKYGTGFVPSFRRHPLAVRALALGPPDGPVADRTGRPRLVTIADLNEHDELATLLHSHLIGELIVNPGGFGVDGFAMAVGGGLSVLLINFLYRLGISGDREREEEERARAYFDEHGEWPEEEERIRGRKWTLAPGVKTAEDESAQRRP